MTSSTKFTKSTRRRRRAPNGQPRPYPDGDRWIAPGVLTFPDGTRKHVRVSAPTQIQATRKLGERIRQELETFERMAQAQSNGPTLNDCVENWLDVTAPIGREYKTIEGYRHAYERWIKPNFEGRYVAEVSVDDIEDLKAVVLACRSVSSWRQVLTVLNHVFKEQVRRKRLAQNPANSVSCPRGTPAPADHLTLEESRKIIAQAKSDGQLARWLLALSAGMRQGECLGLKWEHVELEGPSPRLFVREQLQRQTANGLVLKAPKSRKSIRTIPLNETLVEALRERKVSQTRESEMMGSEWRDGGLVFTNASGLPVDPSNDRKQWHKLLKKAGVRTVKLHAARHTTASLMFAERVPSYTVKDALGHSSIQVTADIYGHVMSEAVGDAVGALADSLCEPPRSACRSTKTGRNVTAQPEAGSHE